MGASLGSSSDTLSNLYTTADSLGPASQAGLPMRLSANIQVGCVGDVLIELCPWTPSTLPIPSIALGQDTCNQSNSVGAPEALGAPALAPQASLLVPVLWTLHHVSSANNIQVGPVIIENELPHHSVYPEGFLSSLLMPASWTLYHVSATKNIQLGPVVIENELPHHRVYTQKISFFLGLLPEPSPTPLPQRASDLAQSSLRTSRHITGCLPEANVCAHPLPTSSSSLFFDHFIQAVKLPLSL
ncbi:hypothetical protein C8F01DRAFT_1093820 [Mycena amicta]|nr:hypothetical protein C8F01DRAFT_1093820 [Mycena amicta]